MAKITITKKRRFVTPGSKTGAVSAKRKVARQPNRKIVKRSIKWDPADHPRHPTGRFKDK